VVILAQDTSGRSPARSSQKTTTVMLVFRLIKFSLVPARQVIASYSVSGYLDIVQLALDIESGGRAAENGISHRENMTAPEHDPAQKVHCASDERHDVTPRR
jgi:hypothetical protein